MRQLRSCDFCGADAVGTFEIIPPELEPTEAEQRRVVLCPDCRERLEALLEPLLARAGADTGPSGSGADGIGGSVNESDAASDRGEGTGRSSIDETDDPEGTDGNGNDDASGGTVVASADDSTRKRARDSSPNATVSDADGAAAGSGTDTAAGETGAETEEETETRTRTAAETDDSVLEDAITFERSDPVDADDTSDDARAGTGGTDESTETTDGADDTAVSAETEKESENESNDSGETDAPAGDDAESDATRPPNAYAKVVRLLRNREFPMQRSAVENLAAGAYDLESHEVDAIIDYAIDQDEFVEESGQLHRP